MSRFNDKSLLNIVYFLFTLVFFSLQLRLAIESFYFDRYSFSALFVSLLCFKLGELLNEITDFGTTKFYAILGTIAIPLILYNTHAFLFFGCFLFGFSVMKVRDKTIHYSSKRVKFTARAIGFILSPVLPLSLLVATSIIATLILLFCRLDDKLKKIKLKWYQKNSDIAGNWSMGIHHFHYFSYAYSIPLIYQLHTTLKYLWLGLIFYIGWAAYNAYERFVKPAWSLVFFGHVVAALSLIMLASATSPFSMTFWWFMTGLGGGTVYMIQPLTSHNKNHETELKISEGFGHVVGIVIWGAGYFVFGVNATFLTGALGGLTVAVIALNRMKLKN